MKNSEPSWWCVGRRVHHTETVTTGSTPQHPSAPRPAPAWRPEIDDVLDRLLVGHEPWPFEATPDRLYTRADLYEGFDDGGLEATTDWAIYLQAEVSGRPPVAPTLALGHRLHDHGITIALDEFRSGRQLVGVMGGHALRRGSPGYDQAVGLGAAVAEAGFCLTTGGGPGAMEAANLGAAASTVDESTRTGWLARLAESPTFYDDADGFAAAALEIAAELTEPVESLAVPTWFYGHEPTNPFATHIAKYFANSVREDGLLAICTSGIVFTKGGPGTAQELFQDAAQNAYRTVGPASPMILLDPPDDPTWWERTGLETALRAVFIDGDGNPRPGADRVHRVADVADVPALLDGDR